MEVSSNPETNERVSDSGIDESVTVVVTTFNDEAYLREALLSIFAQERLPDEVIVVDDGSIVSPSPILKEFPEATLLRKSNGGLSSARNLGLYRARSRYICFLDADDRLEPNAIASGVACFAGSPDVAMVYGGHRRIHANGQPAGSDNYEAVSDNPYTDLLSGNHIGMHATVLYRREVLLALGGFDESLRRCEDYDLYLRIARQFAIASHSDIIAEYRWHGQNMSSNAEEMLEAVLQVHSRYHGQNSCTAQGVARRTAILESMVSTRLPGVDRTGWEVSFEIVHQGYRAFNCETDEESISQRSSARCRSKSSGYVAATGRMGQLRPPIHRHPHQPEFRLGSGYCGRSLLH